MKRVLLVWWGAAGCWGGTVGASLGAVPVENGDDVLRYHVHVVEDDRDCGATTPIKESDESMVVQWHSAHDATLYAYGGLYRLEIHTDDDGAYEERGVGGPCLPGSRVRGHLDRQRGDSTTTCVKRDCTVLIHALASRLGTDGGSPDGG